MKVSVVSIVLAVIVILLATYSGPSLYSPATESTVSLETTVPSKEEIEGIATTSPQIEEAPGNETSSPTPRKNDSKLSSEELAKAEEAARELERAVSNLEANLAAYEQQIAAKREGGKESVAADFAGANDQARKAVVNILCETKSGGSFNPISGSGIIIDSKGLILTNAHIGQYFLLKDYLYSGFLECTIRTGSPARNAYKAELVYISPSWLKANATAITEDSPLGTGESDFALLAITESVNGNDLSPLPFLPFSKLAVPQSGDSLVLAGYPSGFLGGITVQLNLYQLSSVGQVSSLYTLDGTNVDIIEVEGSILSQKGSSGGAFVDGEGNLVGMITTARLEAATTENRSVRAITLEHVNRKITEETGKTLTDIVGNSKESLIASFSQIKPQLAKILTEAIESH